MSQGRSTLAMAGSTALSRVLGYIRDRVLAHLLGTSALGDLFFIAWRIPNTFRRFVAEGAMTSALVPVYTELESLEESNRGRANRFVGRFLTTFFLFLILLTLLGVWATPLLVRILAGRTATQDPLLFARGVSLARVLFPYILLVSISAAFMGLLNCKGRFGLPAFTPVLLNLSIIVAALVAGRGSQHILYWLAGGVLVGGLLQILVQVPAMKAEGFSFIGEPGWRDPSVQKVLRLMGPGILGAGVGQLTVLAGTAMAERVEIGGVSALYYSNRLTELALGVFGIAVAQVVFPALSRAVATGDQKAESDHLGRSLTWVNLVLLGASAGLIVLSRPIVTVLFQGGHFDSSSVAVTLGPLVGYAVRLPR